jgi:hypothetical protein
MAADLEGQRLAEAGTNALKAIVEEIVNRATAKGEPLARLFFPNGIERIYVKLDIGGPFIRGRDRRREGSRVARRPTRFLSR